MIIANAAAACLNLSTPKFLLLAFAFRKAHSSHTTRSACGSDGRARDFEGGDFVAWWVDYAVPWWEGRRKVIDESGGC